MTLTLTHKGVEFGIGDKVRVAQKIKEENKYRLQTFEGVVIRIKGREENKSFTVRRIGAQQIGIERIFPLISPVIEKIEVARKGTKGVRRAKLYYLKTKSKREIEKIYSRAAIRELYKSQAKKATKAPVKKTSSASSKKASKVKKG